MNKLPLIILGGAGIYIFIEIYNKKEKKKEIPFFSEGKKEKEKPEKGRKFTEEELKNKDYISHSISSFGTGFIVSAIGYGTYKGYKIFGSGIGNLAIPI